MLLRRLMWMGTGTVAMWMFLCCALLASNAHAQRRCYAKMDCYGDISLVGQTNDFEKLVTFYFVIPPNGTFPGPDRLLTEYPTQFLELEKRCNQERYRLTPLDPDYTVTWNTDKREMYTSISLECVADGECSVRTGPCYADAHCCDPPEVFHVPVCETTSGTCTSVIEGQAPDFTSRPVTTALVNVQYVYNITVADPNSDPLSITAGMIPGWLNLVDHGNATATLSGTPALIHVGSYPMVVKATDDAGSETSQTFVLSVTTVNTSPEFLSSPVTSAEVAQAYVYNVIVTDSDGDSLTIAGGTIPTWLNLADHGNRTATLSGTPTVADVGAQAVTLTVTDQRVASPVPQSFVINVVSAPNHAPVFTSSPVIQGAADEFYQYEVTATDSDGDSLTLGSTVLPAWLTLFDHDNGTATLSGTPAFAQAGANPVGLTVTDHVVPTPVAQDFVIHVNNGLNNAPVFTSSPVTVATVNVPYVYSVTVTDSDSDPLSVAARTLPTWLSLIDHDNGTATVFGTPSSGEVGDHPVILTLSDGLVFPPVEQGFIVHVFPSPTDGGHIPGSGDSDIPRVSHSDADNLLIVGHGCSCNTVRGGELSGLWLLWMGLLLVRLRHR